MRFKLVFFSLIPFFGLLSGCATIQNQTALANNNFNSTLWVQSSSEYKANSLQAYNSAQRHLKIAKQDPAWTAALEQSADYSNLPAAIILDIDETVLDNSQYQAQMVLTGSSYSQQTWDEWVAMKSAPALPGAVDFLNTAHQQGIEIFYITNRECAPRIAGGETCPQEKDTIDNLKSVGILDATPKNTLLKNERTDWTSEKKTRRMVVAEHYKIIMLFGDDLGDFLPDVKNSITPQERDSLVHKHKENWGVKWFTLANPTYGSWLNILDKPESAYLKGY